MNFIKKPKKPKTSAPVRSQMALLGGSYSLVISAVVLALLIVVNLFVSALPTSMTKYDISSTKLYSITSNTKVVVNALEEDVTIYWIVQAGQEDDVIENLLGKYESLSDHITVAKRNPDVYPTFAEQYTDEEVPNNSLVVESGDRYRYISYNDIYLSDANMYIPPTATAPPSTARVPSPPPSIMWSPRICLSCMCWKVTAKRNCPPPSQISWKRRTTRSTLCRC